MKKYEVLLNLTFGNTPVTINGDSFEVEQGHLLIYRHTETRETGENRLVWAAAPGRWITINEENKEEAAAATTA